MESNDHEESANTSEEVIDQHSDDKENNNLGMGRSYECVFCKRGFNTAQALGGHMNIHRKDRARNKPNPNNKQQEICYTAATRLYQQIPPSTADQMMNNQESHLFSPQHHPHPISSYATYFPESSSSFHHQHDTDHDHRHMTSDDPFIHGDWRMSLSLEFPPAITEDVEKNRQEKDLDLELRLGYDS